MGVIWGVNTIFICAAASYINSSTIYSSTIYSSTLSTSTAAAVIMASGIYSMLSEEA